MEGTLRANFLEELARLFLSALAQSSEGMFLFSGDLKLAPPSEAWRPPPRKSMISNADGY